jgi:(1->4)-alpha-D-glucan 1-alpha-D-glucosylmutase
MSEPEPRPAIIPRATYRVQLHQDFHFADATALVPYWAGLGISHLYCSPFLRARPGSRHGYDVVDHSVINPELGTRADLDRLVEALHGHDMGLLIDVVPNHMGVLGGDNGWWLDVLENGQASAYADFFDIDWQAADPALSGRVLLPLLGEQYGVVLERGELQLQLDADSGRFTLAYYEHRLPLDPTGYGALIRGALAALPVSERSTDAAIERLADRFDRLPPHDVRNDEARRRRQLDKRQLKRQFARCLAEQPALRRAIEQSVTTLNGRPGERASFDALDRLLAVQPYRLAYWRVAGDQINYRRFFDINELAALRMERPEVFAATHGLVLELAASGAVDGLRIDHPDGLADPAGYFRRLQEGYAELAAIDLGTMDPALPAKPLYVLIEKIAAAHEHVPREWAVHGTTGYRFANVVNGVLIDQQAKMRLDRVWRAFVRGEAQEFEAIAHRSRHLVMRDALAGELTVLATALLRLARADRRTRDFTYSLLQRTLAEVIASFPVYRTYIVDTPSAQDCRFIDWAIGRARRLSGAADASAFDFLQRVLLGQPLPDAPAGLDERYRTFAHRLQQYTAPVAAKGIEDTALYRHHRLISTNDVGSDPDSFGVSLAAFHAASRDRATNWPHTMLCTSTHDSKRSEDVRLRIDVLSEMPAAWRLKVRRWSRMNRRHRRSANGLRVPTRNDEYLLYQTLIGSLPASPLDDASLAAYAQRIEQTMLKSAREAKVSTTWTQPDSGYEAGVSNFVQALLTRRESKLFLDDLQATAAVFAWYGALNGLSLALIKCLSPGVPDFYQAHEAIELSLVDPDNRRPVDYARRRALLEQALSLAATADRAPMLGEWLAQAPLIDDLEDLHRRAADQVPQLHVPGLIRRVWRGGLQGSQVAPRLDDDELVFIKLRLPRKSRRKMLSQRVLQAPSLEPHFGEDFAESRDQRIALPGARLDGGNDVDHR